MDIKVIEKELQAVANVASELRSVKAAERKPSQQRTYDVARSLGRLSKADVEKIVKKLNDLDIVRLTPEHKIQIADFLPANKQELESIFTATKTTIKQEDQDRILDVVKGFA
jgi:DNA-directed RNA polymerase subunit F